MCHFIQYPIGIVSVCIIYKSYRNMCIYYLKSTIGIHIYSQYNNLSESNIQSIYVLWGYLYIYIHSF